jgi:hypothetical protein
MSATEAPALTDAGKRAAAAFYLYCEGNDERFLCAVARDVGHVAAARLATEPDLLEAWCERERRRCSESFLYWITCYGIVQPATGPLVPFRLWPAQREAAETIAESHFTIILKARQLGLSWLVLHYAYWLIAFCPAGVRPRVLVFCKTGDDAAKLIGRVKRIRKSQPPWLARDEEPATRTATGSMRLVARGSIEALMGTPSAVRQETATLIVIDEGAFIRNQAGGAVLAGALPAAEHGQLVALSTGNGRTGDGAWFADLWDKARSGESTFVPIFLPFDADPRRSTEWREEQRGNYQTEASWAGEYPVTEEDALSADSTIRVYPLAGIIAAEKLGAIAVRHGLHADAAAEGLEWGIDWGDFQTATVWGAPLAGGGVFVVDELIQSETEPVRASEAILARRPYDWDGATFTTSNADSSPAGTNRTFVAKLREARALEPGTYPDVHTRWPFGQFKEGGGDKRGGVSTVDYLRHLLVNTAELEARLRGATEDVVVAAIAAAPSIMLVGPLCRILSAQLRALEKDPETAKVRKPTPNPNRPLEGDHACDALIALTAARAVRWVEELERRRRESAA